MPNEFLSRTPHPVDVVYPCHSCGGYKAAFISVAFCKLRTNKTVEKSKLLFKTIGVGTKTFHMYNCIFYVSGPRESE